MTQYQPEPVEISTRMRAGEWTEASLSELVATYTQKLQGMGAGPGEIDVVTDRDEGGGVSVVATWKKAAGNGGEVPGEAQG
jgi:hypothetical protein